MQTNQVNQSLSRRAFLGVTGATVGGLALAGCQPSPTKTSDGKVAIEFWHTYKDKVRQPVLDAMDRFNKASTTVSVTDKVYPNYQPILTGIQAGSAAGSLPAVVAAVSLPNMNYVTSQLPHAVLQDVAARANGGSAWLTDGWDPTLRQLGVIGDRQVGLPFGVSQAVLYYNTDLFAKAGVSQPPRTWDELRIAAAQIKERTGVTGLGFGEVEGETWMTEALLNCNGVQLLEKGSAPKTGIGSAQAVAAMTVLADIVRTDKSGTLLSPQEGGQSFMSGQLGMLTATSSYLTSLESGSKFQVGVAPFPGFPAQERHLPAGGNALIIFSQDQAVQDAAFSFLKELASPAGITGLVKATGYTPPRSDVADSSEYLKAWYEADPRRTVSVAQQAHVVAPVAWPNNSVQIGQAVYDGVSKILAGGQNVASTLDGVAKTVDGLIR